MTAISHALIGASLAAKISQPHTLVITAFVTHFLCDAIPHWDLGTNWRLRPKLVTGILAITETFTALVGVYFLFKGSVISSNLLLLSIIVSLLPDWLEAPYYLMLPKPPQIFYYAYKAQSFIHARLKSPEGIITQIVVVGLFLLSGFYV